MKTIVLFDGQCHKSLLPLTYTRPVAHLRVGIFTISEKWVHFFDQDVHIRCKDFLIENALSIISCWPTKFIPCLNLPTEPIIPDNLI